MADHLFAALNHEWHRIARSPAAARRLRQWAAAEPDLAGFADLGDLIEACQRRHDPHRSDTILAALARVAPTDTDAARVVLHAVTPALKNIARSFRWLGSDEADAAVIAAAWERIRTYPATRPNRVAANITLDVRKRLSRQARRDRRQLDAAALAPISTHSSVEEDRLRLLVGAVRSGRIQTHEAQLIANNRIGGTPIPRSASGARLVALRNRAERRGGLAG